MAVFISRKDKVSEAYSHGSVAWFLRFPARRRLGRGAGLLGSATRGGARHLARHRNFPKGGKEIERVINRRFSTVGGVLSEVIHTRIQYESHIFPCWGCCTFVRSAEIPFYRTSKVEYPLDLSQFFEGENSSSVHVRTELLTSSVTTFASFCVISLLSFRIHQTLCSETLAR